jgi:NADH-quinone oxidoreductase subunit F
VDLRLLSAEPSDAEREAIDTVVGGVGADDGRVARADRSRRHLLLPALRAAQRRVGWVSEGALGYASRRLDVPPADAFGVATFYALISLEERPADVLHVCTDLACQLAGADVPPGAHPSPCLGLCERAPASLRTIAGSEPRELPLPEAGPELPQRGESGLRLLRRIAARCLPFARGLRRVAPRFRARPGRRAA